MTAARFRWARARVQVSATMQAKKLTKMLARTFVRALVTEFVRALAWALVRVLVRALAMKAMTMKEWVMMADALIVHRMTVRAPRTATAAMLVVETGARQRPVPPLRAWLRPALSLSLLLPLPLSRPLETPRKAHAEVPLVMPLVMPPVEQSVARPAALVAQHVRLRSAQTSMPAGTRRLAHGAVVRVVCQSTGCPADGLAGSPAGHVSLARSLRRLAFTPVSPNI